MMATDAEKGGVYTIGHSSHSFEDFVSLLQRYGVNAVADVRSVPYSRRHPQFNREVLMDTLKGHDIAYVFLGKELGARSDDAECYENGRVNYRLLAGTPLFQSGIERVRDGSRRRTIALMCAEKDPLNCHRTILVARELARLGLDIKHILADGELESHCEAMKRLVEESGSHEQDMFDPTEDPVEQAYKAREQRIAYTDKDRADAAQQVQQ